MRHANGDCGIVCAIEGLEERAHVENTRGRFWYAVDSLVIVPAAPTYSEYLAARAVGGRKDDSGKDRWMLVPWDAMRLVVRVLMFGAAKYGDHNWLKVLEAPGGEERYIDAAFRHLTTDGNDADTKLPNIAHAICCLLFVLAGRLRRALTK